MSDEIKVELKRGINVIRFNRMGKKNALTRAMYKTMAEAVVAGDNNPDVRVHLFLGGQECFTAGNDIADFMAVATGGDHGTEVMDFLRALTYAKKPMVSGVDGIAVGIGVTMLFHCDQVVASPRAKFKTPFVDLGVVPEGGSSMLAPLLMGYQRAFSLLVMGETFDLEMAHDAGFVAVKSGLDDLEARAFERAEMLASKPPEALALSRTLLRGNAEPQFVEGRIAVEGKHFAERLKSDEAKAAFMSFMTKG